MDRNAAREVERALEWLASEQTRLGGESLLVALSGGIDSMVLADLLMLAADRLGVNALEFAHIDHALRESSAAEARQVADWVHSRGYKIQTIRLDSSLSGSSGKGIEGWARQERYTALEAVRRKLGCRWLLTAHHRDDQAETVLMRLERGCGLGGLIGIKKCDPSRHLLRPLLERSVAELHEWCRRRELPWVEDESNRDLRFRAMRFAVECFRRWSASKRAPLFVWRRSLQRLLAFSRRSGGGRFGVTQQKRPTKGSCWR